MTVTLGDGLDEIGVLAYKNCTSLERIVIPSSVKTIDKSEFKGCSSLTSVKFCYNIEKFVSCESMRDWWNRGVHDKSLCTFCFLVRCSIPERLFGSCTSTQLAGHY